MSLPKNAKLEKVLPGGIAIYDVSHILPQPTKPRFNKRPPGTKVVRVFFHHSGAYGDDGYDGAKDSVNYVIKQRNFGARPYHFWLAYKPDIDDNGNMVVYRLAKNEERCWHTGKRANDEGIGVVWQGNLYPGKTGAPSDSQYKMAEALTKWLIDSLGLELPDGLSFHSEADKWGGDKKLKCPGPYVEDWVKKIRNQPKEESKKKLTNPPDPEGATENNNVSNGEHSLENETSEDTDNNQSPTQQTQSLDSKKQEVTDESEESDSKESLVKTSKNTWLRTLFGSLAKLKLPWCKK